MKKQTIKSLMHGAIMTSSATFASYCFFGYFAAPFIWIGAVWLVVFVCFFILSKSGSRFRFIWYNAAIIVITLTLFESYLWLAKKSELEIIRDPKTTTYTNDFLGYAPVKKIKYTETQYYDGELANSLTFTVDENGLRISPSPKSSSIKGDVILFGCSYTYGAGVNDWETMPYQVGLMSERNYRIHNFAYMGYGAHQMLSSIENGLVENIVWRDDKPKFVIYQAIFDHIRRSAHCVHWDCHAPHYKLGADGEVFYSGHFDDNDIIPQRVKRKLFNKFQIYKTIVQSKKALRDGDIELFLGIVNASKKRIEAKYHGSKFYIIWWDNKRDQNNVNILNLIKSMQIKVYLISDILPDYENHKSTYQLNSHDKHPNALAHRIIAKYITDNILDVHVSREKH